MERRPIAHIAVLVAALCTCGLLLEGTAWSKTAPAKAPLARSCVVKSGDGGWFQVAHAHGTTMQHLLAANHASAGTPVKAGQRIQLPADAKDAKPSKTVHPTQARRPSGH